MNTQTSEGLINSEKRNPQRINGILPAQQINHLIKTSTISASIPFINGQVQPASLDLRLGSIAHRVRASFLPGTDRTVLDSVKSLGMHTIDLTDGAVLERGCVYIVPLLEQLQLGRSLSGAANPKSSTGRLDVFTRLITNNATEFDRVRAGYCGPLYAEISPRTFSILVRPGDRLSQIRFRRGRPLANDAAIRALHEQVPLVHNVNGEINIADGGIAISVDLKGGKKNVLLGYRAKRHTDLIDLSKISYYEPHYFWEPIHAKKGETTLVLNPEDFYILASKELVSVPPDYAAELVPYDPLVGEFRVHYAGFFDPGFGYADDLKGQGTRAVLEVRSRDVPFVLEDSQIVGRLAYEKMAGVPNKLYGDSIGSNYSTQGLALSKYFRQS